MSITPSDSLAGAGERESGLYRIGRRVAQNVYRGDRPMFMAATAADAAEMVATLNAGLAALAQPTAPGPGGGEAKVDHVRLLKEALFACLGSGVDHAEYGGVLTDGGRSAWVHFRKVDSVTSDAFIRDQEDRANRPAQAEAGAAVDRLLGRRLYDGEGRLRFMRDAPLADIIGRSLTVGDIADLLATPKPEAPAAGRSEGEEAAWCEELDLSDDVRKLVNTDPALLSLLYDLDLLPEQLASQDEKTPGLIKAYHRLYGVLYAYQAFVASRVPVAPVTRSPDAGGLEPLREALKEITEAADQLLITLPDHWHDDATIRLTDAAADAHTALSAVEQDDLYRVKDDTPPAAGPGLDREAGAATAYSKAVNEYWADSTVENPDKFVAHKIGIRAILALATRAAGTSGDLPWRDMRTAPASEPIVAKHRPTPRMPHGWVATIRLGHGDDERPGMHDTILHYNGDDLLHRFHGMWEGWLPVDALSVRSAEPTTPDPARSGSGAVAGEEQKPDWVARAAWCAEGIQGLFPDDLACEVDDERGLSLGHLKRMAVMLARRDVDGPTKACRWLGWLQAGIVAAGLSTLEAEKQRNLASGRILALATIQSDPQGGEADGGGR